MRKERFSQFFQEEGIISILLRKKFLVLMMILASVFVSARSNPNASEFQQIVVTGTVTDQQGVAVTGVTVMVKGTTNGTLTDILGKYTLSNVPSNATLSFTFIGMAPQEVPVGGQTRLNVVMKEATLTLEEVVVIGYGVQKKESVVGSISQTTNEQLKRSGKVTDFTQALTGQLPGITTMVNSGQPGGVGLTGEGATQVFIRGQSTWNGGQPLILVDGVERSMDRLNVNEVESVSVLKDASATAVFGVKGANGVIMITTKRGSIGKPKLSFSYSTTMQQISKLPGKLDSYETLMLKNETIEREAPLSSVSWADFMSYEIVKRYQKPQKPEYVDIYPNVDWEKAIFKNAGYSHNAAFNVQGGTRAVNYFGSLAYVYEGDMLKDYNNHKGYNPNYDYNRLNFRSNFDFKLTNTTTLKFNLSGYMDQRNTQYGFPETSSGVNSWGYNGIYGMPPDAFIPQYADGRWGASYTVPTEGLPNTAAYFYNIGINELRSTNLMSDFKLEQNLDFITKGLSATASFFYDNTVKYTGGGPRDQSDNVTTGNCNTLQRVITPSLYTGPNQDPSEYMKDLPIIGTNQFDFVVKPWYIQAEAFLADQTLRRTMYQFQLNYGRKFNLHNVGLMGLVKGEEYARGSMFKNYRADWVFRATYDYDSKYLFETNGAYNGSEQFGPGYRFDFFPSAALGWLVTNEDFFKVDWINRLKFRYSIGMIGDDKVSSDRWLYSTQLRYSGATRMSENPQISSPYTWYSVLVEGNPDIHWEKAKKNNFGFELSLFKDLISINYDYFTEKRTDILIAGSSRQSVPDFVGTVPPSLNKGRVNSKGYELELKFNKRQITGVHYWAEIALSHNENKILEKDDPILLSPYLKAQGYTIGQTRTTVRTGFYNNWDEVFASVPTETNDIQKMPGFYNLVDFNGDGVIKSSEDQIPFAYSSIPQNTYSFTLGADYKGFSIMAQLYGVNNVSRNQPAQDFFLATNVLFAHCRDYWSKDNQNASSYLPRLKTQAQNIGDYYIFDASYMRLKNVEIAYNLPDNLLQKIGLSSLKIFLNGNNLLFWSKLPDDREAVNSGGSASQGAYPTVKRISLGIDLTF
jgi:TonB-linked SusC/RagA family outer membrane protein